MIRYYVTDGLPYASMEDKYHFIDNEPVAVKVGVVDVSKYYGEKYEVFWDFGFDTIKIARTNSKSEAIHLFRDWLKCAVYCA